jgi:DNA-binding NarL/FixJ family response regulator
VRAVIAEDSPLMRRGIAQVLTDSGVDVAAQVDTGEALLEAVRTEAPDVAIVDIRLPPTHTDEGAQAASQLRAEHPDVGVLMLSQFLELAHARRFFTEAPKGFGYLLKDRVLNIDDFLESVRRVARGGTAIDPDVVGQLLGRSQAPDALAELSPREREVLALMAEGLSNEGICERLFLTPKTVETHVTSIFRKLTITTDPKDRHRRVQAVLMYLDATDR